MALLVVTSLTFVAYKVLSYKQYEEPLRLKAKNEYLRMLSDHKGQLSKKPNIIFILFDDMGYGDIGAGADDRAGDLIKTPNLDALASEGLSFSNFYSPVPSCTPARAGFLTGRLPLRAGMPAVVFPTDSFVGGVLSKVISPDHNSRFPEEEITLANILSSVGYKTGIVGKWHLGDRSPSLPNDMGFGEFFGSLYSNDMTPFSLYRNKDVVVEAPVNQEILSETYTREVVDFIERSEDESFFLYFAHNFPHDPLHVRPSLSGQSDAGLYGDVLEEVDRGIGEILNALDRTGHRDNTMIVVSSDNGPWFLGRAGNLRGRKGNTFEGGMRVPFIVNWPNNVEQGSVSPAMTMGTDLVPTILDVLGLPEPVDRIMDGRSLVPLLVDPSSSVYEYLYYFEREMLFSVRDKRFKYRGENDVIHFTDSMSFGAGMPQKEWLFDLSADPLESYDTSLHNPKDLVRLRREFNRKQKEMQENKRGWLP